MVRRLRKNRIRLAYAAFVTAALGTLFLTEVWPADSFFRTYGPNLVAEILGILLTIAVVERLLRWERERQLEPLRMVGTRRIGDSLRQLVELLAWMYKSAALPGSPAPKTIEELIDLWASEVVYLNLKAAPRIVPPRTWAQYAAECMERFEVAILSDLDRYSEALAGQMTIPVEDVLDDNVMRIIKLVKNVPAVDAEQRNSRPYFLVFGTDSIDLEAFGRKILKLIEVYDALAPSPMEIPKMWGETPPWGDARSTEALAKTEDPSPSS